MGYTLHNTHYTLHITLYLCKQMADFQFRRNKCNHHIFKYCWMQSQQNGNSKWDNSEKYMPIKHRSMCGKISSWNFILLILFFCPFVLSTLQIKLDFHSFPSWIWSGFFHTSFIYSFSTAVAIVFRCFQLEYINICV